MHVTGRVWSEDRQLFREFVTLIVLKWCLSRLALVKLALDYLAGELLQVFLSLLHPSLGAGGTTSGFFVGFRG